MKTRRLMLVALLSLATSALYAQTATSATTASATTTPATALTEYAGTYNFSGDGPLKTYTITVKDGELYGDAGMGGANKLVRQDKTDQYKSTSSYGSIITFTRDATTKAVTGLTLAVQDQELSATKAK